MGSLSSCCMVCTQFCDESLETVSNVLIHLLVVFCVSAAALEGLAEVVNSSFVRYQQKKKIKSDNLRPPGSKYSEFSQSVETD